MDDTQTGSVDVSIRNARSAALFKRPTKAWKDTLAAGGEGLRVLALEHVMPVEGGLPLTVGSAIAGAIGVSGGTSPVARTATGACTPLCCGPVSRPAPSWSGR
jgi:uncharacterized protein GlcG (DUF336 family)